MAISDRTTGETVPHRVRLHCTTRHATDWLAPAACLLFAGVGIDLLVQGVTGADGSTSLAMGGVITAIMTFLLTASAKQQLRPVILTDRALLVPKAFGRTVVPLHRLSGVGLLFQEMPGRPGPPGWQLHVWDGDKKIEVVSIAVLSGRRIDAQGRKHLFTWKRDLSLPLPHEDLDVLAASRQGQIARRIYDAALAVQGPSGPLATRAMQKSVEPRPDMRTVYYAWWSPDETMGRTATRRGTSGASTPSGNRTGPAESASEHRSPELVRARTRYLLYVLVDSALFVALAVVAFVKLGRPGLPRYLPAGEMCRPVMSTAPRHASTVCNAWRHHQLIQFTQIAVVIGVLIVAVVLLVRAQRNLQRLTREANR